MPDRHTDRNDIQASGRPVKHKAGRPRKVQMIEERLITLDVGNKRDRHKGNVDDPSRRIRLPANDVASNPGRGLVPTAEFGHLDEPYNAYLSELDPRSGTDRSDAVRL